MIGSLAQNDQIALHLFLQCQVLLLQIGNQDEIRHRARGFGGNLFFKFGTFLSE